VAAEEAAGELDELYQAQYGNVVAMAYALTGDLAEAQDLVQEGFCRAWQRWRRIAGYDDPLAWVDGWQRRVPVDRRPPAGRRLAGRRLTAGRGAARPGGRARWRLSEVGGPTGCGLC